MANEAQVKQLLELCTVCTQTTVDQLIGGADWEPSNYAQGRHALERTFAILNQFKRLPIGLLPDPIIARIIAALRPLPATLEALRGFSAERPHAAAARRRLVARYCRQADRLCGAALLYNCLPCALGGRRSVSTPCAACLLDKPARAKD